MAKPVQEQFGEKIIKAVGDFARDEMDDIPTLEGKYLFHVGNAGFRRTLAETLYGARWIYKLGLALLVTDAEQMAHVRAQLIDYCSVCEGVLSDMIVHGIDNGHMTGQKYQYKNVNHNTGPINWANSSAQIEKRNLYWLIEVARDEKIVTPTLKNDLHWLRKERNSVHLRARNYKSFLGKSHKAFGIMRKVFTQTQKWRAANA